MLAGQLGATAPCIFPPWCGQQIASYGAAIVDGRWLQVASPGNKIGSPAVPIGGATLTAKPESLRLVPVHWSIVT
jgi:hypothetical protein